MTDHRNPESERIVPNDEAPDHGPNFWADLDTAMAREPQVAAQSGVAATGDRTQQMPRVAAAAGAPNRLVPAPSSPSRRLWPLAAAAAILAVLGIGFVAVRATNDPGSTTEIVAAEPSAVADTAPLDGPDDEDADVDDTSEAAQPDQTGSDETQPGDTPAAGDVTGDADDGSASSGDTTNDGAGGADSAAEGDGPAVQAPPIPDFALAPGARGTPDFLPLDQGLPADATFLADWPEQQLTWYGVSDPDTSCVNANHAEIRYVNASGITQLVRDPQPRFSGEISHYTVSADANRAAWIVGCGTQLEMYVADLEPTGEMLDLQLVWIGEGTISSALVMWDDTEVTINAIEPGGTAFAVAYDVGTEILSRNGGPSRIMLEEGAPASRSLTPLAATPDGGLSYWTGAAPAGSATTCAALYGTDRTDTLWLRQGEGQWQSAVGVDYPMGTVTAGALEADSLQFAFADVCDGEVGRVVVGSVEPDGRLSGLREIDLTPYVPGFVAQLHWVDDDTLRIETDNSEFRIDPIRFDFRLEDGVIVQLD